MKSDYQLHPTVLFGLQSNMIKPDDLLCNWLPSEKLEGCG